MKNRGDQGRTLYARLAVWPDVQKIKSIAVKMHLELPKRSGPTFVHARSKLRDMKAKILFNADRRIATRLEVNQSAKALVPNAPEAVSCVIVDISDTGAKISVTDENCFLPKKMKLYIADKHIIADCEQMWRRGRDIGLAFTSTANFE